MLSLNAGLQGALGISLCFLSSGVSFVLSCVPWESLRYPQVSPLTKVFFPSVCLLEHLSECLLSFSPPKLLPPGLLPPWWLVSLTHASAGVLWAAVLARWCFCTGVGAGCDWYGATRGLLPHGSLCNSPPPKVCWFCPI